jgi:regulator of extracellular matrix RemA (YlzA/DUF370 family)
MQIMNPIVLNEHGQGWIEVGRGGAIAASRVVAVAQANSAPVKRLLQAAGPARVLNLTYGDPRETVLILDSGHLAITSIPMNALLNRLRTLPSP